jgi:hypothetical protein
MPWMKVLRNPRLNRTVVSVALDTAVNFARVFSLNGMAEPLVSEDVCAEDSVSR